MPNRPMKTSNIGPVILYGIFAITFVIFLLIESKFTERISPCCSENLSLLLNLLFNKFIKSLSNSIACNFLISESNNLDVKAPLP